MPNLLDPLKRFFQREDEEPVDASITAKKPRTKPDWRVKAIKTAAERHGKAFKVGPDTFARQIMVEGEFVLKQPGDPLPKAAQKANVTPIAGKKARG